MKKLEDNNSWQNLIPSIGEDGVSVWPHSLVGAVTVCPLAPKHSAKGLDRCALCVRGREQQMLWQNRHM